MEILTTPSRVLALAVLIGVAACDESSRPSSDQKSPAPELPAALSDLDVGTTPAADRPATARERGQPPPVNECSASKPDWIFCSSFEEGSKAIWDDYDKNPDTENQLMADPGPFALAGNHVIRLRVPPGRGGSDLIKVLPSQHDKLYARWYVKWEKGYNFAAPNHGSGLFAGDRKYLGVSDNRPDGSWYVGLIEPQPSLKRLNIYAYYRGMYMDCANPVGSCWGDHFPCMVDEGKTYCTKPEHREKVMPPELQDDRWYCLELMVDGGTATSSASGATGAFDFWVDGVEIGPWPNLWMRTQASAKLSIMWLSLFHHDATHSVEGQLIDNLVVSKTRVGCP